MIMTKNISNIKDGIVALTHHPNELVSGTMVPGSLDEDSYTISVLPTAGTDAIDGVLLNAVTENGNGLILFPADNSNVIIGSIDGPGEWTLIRASDITKAMITIGTSKVTIIDGTITFNDGSNNGLPKADAIAQKLNNLENDINTLKQIFSTGWVVVPNDGGAALKAAATVWSGNTLTDTISSDLQNTAVKH